MLTKLLITIAVIASVIWFSKRKSRPVEPEMPELPASRLLHRVAPLFALLLVVLALAWFGFDWYRSQQVMKVTVTAADGVESVYMVKRAEIDGRKLVTVDGLAVQLSQLDRIEISQE